MLVVLPVNLLLPLIFIVGLFKYLNRSTAVFFKLANYFFLNTEGENR